MAAGPLVGIVAAAGSGRRLGSGRPKAFVTCGGRPLLDWSIDALATVCDRVIVAVPPGHEKGADRVIGGASRSESVRRAVAAAPDAGVYVVHDAARPLATADLVRRCVEALGPGVDGAVAATLVADTVKRTDEGGRVLETLDRSSLWAIQTPQAFSGAALRSALDAGDEALAAATDDAALVEAAGGSVMVVSAVAENLKVTSAVDLAVAERLLTERGAVTSERDTI